MSAESQGPVDLQQKKRKMCVRVLTGWCWRKGRHIAQ